MKILKESYSIDTSEPGFVHVQHVQQIDSGVDLGGPVWFERANRDWASPPGLRVERDELPGGPGRTLFAQRGSARWY